MTKLIFLTLLTFTLIAQTQVGPRTYTGTQDAHGASKTLPHRTGTGSPVGRDTCATVGETYFQTDATPGNNTFACTATPGTWTLQGGAGGGGSTIFLALHAGFTAYNNPASNITGTVSYTDYSTQAATVYRGPGLATITEPVSMTRSLVSVTTAFQAAVGAPAISGLQISIGTAANSTAYMNPVQVGYQLSSASCAGGLGTFTLASPTSLANQTATVAVSGVNPANYNGTFTPAWLTTTTFTASMTCAAYVSGGMVGLQGLIAGNFAALPQGMSGTNTAYLYLTVTNTNPGTFSGNLLAGAVKVMLEGVQVQ